MAEEVPGLTEVDALTALENGSEGTLTRGTDRLDNVVERAADPVYLVRCWFVISAKAIRRAVPAFMPLRPFPALGFLLRFAFDACGCLVTF